MQTKDYFSFGKRLNPASFFFAVVCVMIAFNFAQLYNDTLATLKQRKETPFFFSGFKFLGLEELFRHTAYVGYYTDKDIAHDRQAAAEFGQAQYILAPTILNLNRFDHEYILFNCSTEEAAFRKIKDIGALPMKKNAFGIVLARKIR